MRTTICLSSRTSSPPADPCAAAITAAIRASPDLLRQCRFELDRFVVSTVQKLKVNLDKFLAQPDYVCAGGRTQSQKTAFKTVLSMICERLGLCLFIVTDTVPNRDDLTTKINGHLDLLPADAARPQVISIAPGGGLVTAESAVMQCVQGGGTVVLSKTPAQLKKAKDMIVKARGLNALKGQHYVLVVDEADELAWRTLDEKLKMEKALNELNGSLQEPGTHFYGPQLIHDISATLLPVFFKALHKQYHFQPDSLFFINPGCDYSGFENMQPLQFGGGNVFLDDGELKKKNYYCSDKVIALYADAYQKPRSLLLDVSCPGVTADANVYERGVYLQGMFPELYVVVRVGPRNGHSGISLRVPGSGSWVHMPKIIEFDDGTQRKRSAGDVLQCIDDNYGIDVRVAVIGYTMMQRGNSFRSNHRVPTHILDAIGRTMSLEKHLQTLGRATFQGLHTLRDNNFEHITVLTRPGDFDVCMQYSNFMTELVDKLAAGWSLEECLTSEEVQYSSQANFRALNNRPIGPSKLCLSVGASFEPRPEASPVPLGEAAVEQMLEDDDELDEMYTLLGDISTENQNEPLTVEEFFEEVQFRFAAQDDEDEGQKITQKFINAKLLQLYRMDLFDRSKVEQPGRDDRRGTWCRTSGRFGYFKKP